MTTNFIVLSHGRTGSTFLMHQLDAHPDISAGMEVFHPNYDSRHPLNGQRWEEGVDTNGFVEINFFHSPAISQKVRGFKLFYFHAGGIESNTSIWRRVKSDPSIKVILLHRKNIFSAHVSEERARITSIWHPKPGMEHEYQNRVSMSIDCKKAVNYIVRTENQQKAGMEMAKLKRDFLSISYEDLSQKTEETLNSVFKFLGCSILSSVVGNFSSGSGSSDYTLIQNIDEVEASLSEIGCGWMVKPYRQEKPIISSSGV